jgi:menaquinone-dependent protoporphyrinogen oxidase
MSALVAYATKHGMTKAYAEAMAAEIGSGTKVVDLASRDAKGIDLASYDTVILGSGVYAGRPRPALASFLHDRSTELARKRLGLFLCGMAKGTEARAKLAEVFPETLRTRAKASAYLPGFIYKEKLGGLERIVIGMIEKSQKKQGAPEPSEPDLEANAAGFVRELGS